MSFVRFVVLFAAALTALSRSEWSPVAPGSAAQERAVFNNDPLSVRDAFLRVLSRSKAPGGVALESNCATQNAGAPIDDASASLEESLNHIVKRVPQYRWESDRGAINLLLVTGEPEPLKIRIKEFRAHNATSLELALEQLLALPEVRAHATGRLINQGFRFGGLSSPREQLLKIYSRDTTLREALNSIARAHGHAVWVYTERHCDGQHSISIDFLVK